MRYIAHPEYDAFEAIIETLLSKQAPTREAIENVIDIVIDRISYFENEKNKNLFPDKIIWEKSISDNLTKLYTVKTEIREKIVNNIKQKSKKVNGAAICPYCNTSPCTDMDHFLPKSRYPEYSILPGNLIWCCHQCNTKKKIKGERGLTNIIWPYEKSLEGKRFLYCDIIEDSEEMPIIEFMIKNDEIDNSILKRIKNHFIEMDLNSIFATQSILELRIFFLNKNECKLNPEKKGFLIDYYEEKKIASGDLYGVNHYNYCLSETLAMKIKKL